MKNDEIRSPQINHLSWSRMEVDGVGIGKDFKLWPGGGREWDWGEIDTHHLPGRQPVDVKELLDNDSQTIVLSRGMLLALRTCRETLEILREQHITVYIAETKEAIKLYNGLAFAEKAVGGLFHSTF